MRFFPKITLILTFSVIISQAANWPAWRGPRALGSSEGGQYPADLPSPVNLAWKLALPGKGCSTPIVWENRIFITGPKKGQDTISAVSWEGKVLWEKSLGKEKPGKHRNGSGSNPSAITDGKYVYTYFKELCSAAIQS